MGICTSCTQPSTQGAVVIFPQEKQPGEAQLTETDGEFSLGNELFTAKFINNNGKLMFAGSPELGLMPETEIFKIRLADGTEVPASAMELKEIRTVELKGDKNAVKGAKRFNGQSIEAKFDYKDLDITWRAILRDGSHYLRTEMDLTANEDVAMHSIVPMIYNVDNQNGKAIPEVVGNTRGAVIASSRIFAGLETPTGINTAGYAQTGDDDWIPVKTAEMNAAWQNKIGSNEMLTGSWNPTDWKVSANIPKRINELGFYGDDVKNIIMNLEISTPGTLSSEFLYKNGSCGLSIVGMDLLDADGNVAASDYHKGFAGGKLTKNVYSLNVPYNGNFKLRLFCENKTEENVSSGNINLKLKVEEKAETAKADTGTTPIQGLWSRNTTLQKGKTWNVGAVVGIIAEGQARRSFLAYSERERAVPWRAMPVYISWYELNIDRNNDREYTTNMNVEQCTDVVAEWKKQFFDKYKTGVKAFVWDDGWDFYGPWTFNKNFPNGFKEPDSIARLMGTGIGAWLGPVGGYGRSGDYRRAYWAEKGGMQLSNPEYYKMFLDACTYMIKNYDFRFFKYDGISAQFSAVGPDPGTRGEENAEAIINIERETRKIKEDIFLNTTVGTWASPFWFQFTDAVWRQEADYSEIGNQGSDRERWITYRDRLVYQNFVQNSPLCPINTLMTHGFILSRWGAVSKDMDYDGIVREMRCAFACGSGMVELYNDYKLMNEINNGALWKDLAECIAWQEANADVLPDIHWVGGNPWDGKKANIYGWAAWNAKKAVLTLRNPSASEQSITLTLREALDIPAYIKTSITLNDAFQQEALPGLATGQKIDIDTPLTITMPASSVFIYNGIDNK
jgi:hypothetical protein